MRLAVLASHEGSTLQALIDACTAKDLDATIALVISNNSQSGAIQRAEQASTADAEPAWLDTIFPEADVPIVAATDYVRALPRMIASWITGPFTALGTDGFGMSERRSDLRAHFKVDAASIADAARGLTAS